MWFGQSLGSNGSYPGEKVLNKESRPRYGSDKWNKIVQFLEKELRGVQMCVANAKSKQNLFSNSERPGNAEKSTKFGLYGRDETTYHKMGAGMDEKPICDICGKNDHKTYVSPHINNRKVSYLACSKFVNMSPRDRQTFLDDKGFSQP